MMNKKKNNSGKVPDSNGEDHNKGGEKVIKLVIPEELCFLFSEEVMGHLISARREVLLALRSIIDHRLEGLEKKRKTAGKVRAIRIEVE